MPDPENPRQLRIQEAIRVFGEERFRNLTEVQRSNFVADALGGGRSIRGLVSSAPSNSSARFDEPIFANQQSGDPVTPASESQAVNRVPTGELYSLNSNRPSLSRRNRGLPPLEAGETDFLSSARKPRDLRDGDFGVDDPLQARSLERAEFIENQPQEFESAQIPRETDEANAQANAKGDLTKEPESEAQKESRLAQAFYMTGLGLKQYESGIGKSSPYERYGGLITAAAGLSRFSKTDPDSTWGKFAPGFAVLGTMVNMYGQRRSAEAERKHRKNFVRNLTNAVAYVDRI